MVARHIYRLRIGRADMRMRPAMNGSNLQDARGSHSVFPIHSRRLLRGGSLLMFVLSLWVYWPAYDPGAVIPNDMEPFLVANNLRLTGQFANPFAPLHTGPTAHLAPVVPAFLALLTKVFGVHGSGVFACKFAVAFSVSFLLGLFPFMSELLGMGVLTGFLAAGFWLVATVALHPAWEASYACVLTAVASCCFRRALVSTASGKTFILLGFLIGLLVLMSPTTSPVFFCWLIWLASSRRTALLKAPAVALIILPVLIVSPWVVRNYLVFHRLILVRDNLGLELSLSNNHCADFSLRENEERGCFLRIHPNASVQEAKKVLAMGELGFNDMRLHEAQVWIAENPHRFLTLSAKRLVAFWLPHEHGIPIPYSRERRIIYLMTGLSAVGLWILARRDRDSAIICALWLGVYPILFYVTQFDARYRLPIMWTTFLLGTLPLSVLVIRLRVLTR